MLDIVLVTFNVVLVTFDAVTLTFDVERNGIYENL